MYIKIKIELSSFKSSDNIMRYDIHRVLPAKYIFISGRYFTNSIFILLHTHNYRYANFNQLTGQFDMTVIALTVHKN